jgi:N-methylhydantoinase A/oxoprolinase/acetone carboxylase beta subunit
LLSISLLLEFAKPQLTSMKAKPQHLRETIDGEVFVPFSEAAERAGVSFATIANWAENGSDRAGHTIRTAEGRGGRLLVAAADVAKLRKSGRGHIDRYEHHQITIGGKDYYTPTTAAKLLGVKRHHISRWMEEGSALGFSLDILVRRPESGKGRVISKESLFQIAEAARNTNLRSEGFKIKTPAKLKQACDLISK